MNITMITQRCVKLNFEILTLTNYPADGAQGQDEACDAYETTGTYSKNHAVCTSSLAHTYAAWTCTLDTTKLRVVQVTEQSMVRTTVKQIPISNNCKQSLQSEAHLCADLRALY
jgi:hypothetical protein